MAVQVGSGAIPAKSRRRIRPALIVIYAYLGISAVCLISYVVIRISEIPEGIRVFIPLSAVVLFVLIAAVCYIRDLAKKPDW